MLHDSMDNYDDGLVHQHQWATEPFSPVPMPGDRLILRSSEEQFDDGLVHGHAWAQGNARRR